MASKTDETVPPPNPGGYTAVVHFHGMGSQRRLEETSRMVDALDKHQRQSTASGSPLGMLMGIQPRLEQRRDAVNIGHNESFIRAWWKHPTDKETPGKYIRFYEVYWAPIMAEGKSVRRTLLWLLSQSIRPLRTVTTPWRERQRLRRAVLMELGEGSLWTSITPRDKDIQLLAARYRDFEGLDAHEAFPEGGWEDFLRFIRSQLGVEEKERQDEATIDRLIALSHLWRKRYHASEARAFFLLTTLMLTIALATGGFLWACAEITRTIFASAAVSTGLQSLLPLVGSEANVTTILFVAILSLIGITRFITDALGDVEAWSTYAETNEKHRLRKAVLASGTGLLTHILADKECTRVVVTAHSLGTAIANDTLLALARGNRAINETYRMRGDPALGGVDLSRIEHFITFGSPIDKIEYFFESSRSRSHRYRRVTEDLRGDIGEEPFLANTKPHIHWINLWDDADLVSGPLHSPASAARNRNQVDNLHLMGFGFPDPVAAHTKYLSYKPMISILYDIILFRKLSFPGMSLADKKAKRYGPLIVGPGTGISSRRWLQRLALAIPWILAITLLLHWFAGIPAGPGAALAAAIATFLGIALVASARKGPLNPL